MKAITVNQQGFGEIELVDKPMPTVDVGQALVKIEYCGVCHTDLHVANGDFGQVPQRTLGHEGIGKVVEVAPDVSSLKVGDRVCIAWFYQGCNHCEYCNTGRETLCRSVKNSGYSVDGAMAQYCVVDANYSVKVPEGLNPAQASSITCAGVTCYKAIKVANTQPGQWVAIYGCGGLGNLAIQYAKRVFNTHVIAIDINDDKLALAKQVGADITINSQNQADAIELIKQYSDGGVHAAVVTAVAKEAFNQAVDALRAGGSLVAVGLPSENMQLPIVKTVLDGINVIGSLVGTRKDLQEALQFGAQGLVVPVVETCAYTQAPEVFSQMQAGTIQGRMVLDFNNAD